MRVEIRAGIAEKKTAFKNRITEIRNHDTGVKKKLLLSAGLGLATFGTSWIGIPTFVLKESGWVESWAPGSLNTGLALGLGYGINITSFLVNLNQGRRLLQNEQIEMSQNFPATVVYHGLGKVDFLKEKRKERSIAAVSAPTMASLITLAILRESAFLSFAALSPEKMREVVILKSAQGVFYLIQSGAAEIILRTIGREKKKTQSIPANGVVFEQAGVKDKV